MQNYFFCFQGTGEILEEIVSRDRQKEINKQATLADGDSFQRGVKSRLGMKGRLGEKERRS